MSPQMDRADRQAKKKAINQAALKVLDQVLGPAGFLLFTTRPEFPNSHVTGRAVRYRPLFGYHMERQFFLLLEKCREKNKHKE